jgi:hypothetical protein
MSAQTWGETIITSQTASVALTASNTPTTILPPQAVATLQQGLIAYVGKTLRLTAYGVISNIITTPGTLTLDIRLGAVVAWNGGAMQLNAVAKTNVPWKLSVLLTARTLGTGAAEPTAQLMGIGEFISESVVGSPLPSVGGAGTLMLPASAPVIGTVFDSTAALTVNLFGTFSLNNANSITTYLYALEVLN